MADTICSEYTHEPLPGTAKPGKLFIALEHHYGWSHDILDGGVYGDEVTARLKKWIADRGAKLQLIRKPGRLGQIDCTGLNLFITHCTPSAIDGDVYMEHRLVGDVEELMTLDIRLGHKTEGASKVDHPLLLVCTHGKRDRCCAVKGRPIAAAMESLYPNMVWETSHSKGHRFAPALTLLPWNYAYGRLSAVETRDLIEEARQGIIHENGCRGRGSFAAPGQVAELAARTEAKCWQAAALISVEVEGNHVTVVLNDGDSTRTFDVIVEEMVTEGVVSSCGDEPGPKKGWRAADVVETRLLSGA